MASEKLSIPPFSGSQAASGALTRRKGEPVPASALTRRKGALTRQKGALTRRKGEPVPASICKCCVRRLCSHVRGTCSCKQACCNLRSLLDLHTSFATICSSQAGGEAWRRQREGYRNSTQHQHLSSAPSHLLCQ